MLEALETAPAVYDAAEVWLEAGDWFVWQLVGGEADDLPRSTCQAGYKAMWSREDGYPSSEFFAALNPKMTDVVAEKMPGRLLAPGQCAGELCEDVAKKFGLPPGLPVSAAIIDAHAGVPGAGVAEADTMVLVMGTSSCHMLNSEQDVRARASPEWSRTAFSPAFSATKPARPPWATPSIGCGLWWARSNFRELTKRARALAPGADGVRCMDWFNGCRTPLMDGSLRGAFTGLALHHGQHHLYRALLEASAFGVRWIIDVLEEAGVPVKRLVATGGLPHHNPFLVQIYADVLGRPITIHPSKQGPALGAAILGVLAAGHKATGFRSAAAAIHAMARPSPDVPGREPSIVRPDRAANRRYHEVYLDYRKLAALVESLAHPEKE